MSIALVRLSVILPLNILSTILLSVWCGVGGFAYNSSSRMIMMYTASLEMMLILVSSYSVADVVTCLMMCEILSTAPLFGGTDVSLDSKKCPPARMHALGSLR